MELDEDLLASIASGGLGHWYEGSNGSKSYVKDDDCVACLKDLQRFFRFDNQTERRAFFAISKYNFARSDLVPLILAYPEDYDVVFNALKVCVYLTMPSPEPDTVQPQQQASHMIQVCDAFLTQDALAVIVGLLADPLSRHPKMNEKDTALVELVITFLRNLIEATISPVAGLNPMAEDTNSRIRQGLIKRFFEDDVLELALLMAQHARERPFKSQASVLLQFFLALFTDVTPDLLLSSPYVLHRVEADAARVEQASKKSMHDAFLRQQQARTSAKSAAARGIIPAMPNASAGRTIISKGPARTQYAAAVYSRRHLDHGAAVLVRHRPGAAELPSIESITVPKHSKAQMRQQHGTNPTSNGAVNAITGGGGGRNSASPATMMQNSSGRRCNTKPAVVLESARLRVKLDEYLSRFLEEAYTPLVGQVFKDARSGLGMSTLEEEDFERFLRFVSFCTQYVRQREELAYQTKLASSSKAAPNDLVGGDDDGGGGNVQADDNTKSPFECLSSTMGWDSFHMVLVLLQVSKDREIQRMKDKALKNIPRRYVLLDAIGPLLREMLLTLDLARVAGNASDRLAADRLQRRLAADEGKDSGVLEIIARTMKEFSFTAHSRAHAVHLVEVMHLVLGMLERLTNDLGGLVVRKEIHHRHRQARDDTNEDDANDESKKKLKKQSSHGPGTVQIEEEEVRVGGKLMREGVAMTLTTAEEGTESEGDAHVRVTFNIVQIEDEDDPRLQDNANGDEEMELSEDGWEDDEMEDGGDGDSEHGDGDDEQHATTKDKKKKKPSTGAATASRQREGQQSYRDVKYDFLHRLRKACAHPAILQFYIWILQGYGTNSPLTNAAIASFFARFSTSLEEGGLGLVAMLWQLSVLRVFHAIMDDRGIRNDPQYAGLLRVAIKVTRSLFERLAPPEEALVVVAEGDEVNKNGEGDVVLVDGSSPLEAGGGGAGAAPVAAASDKDENDNNDEIAAENEEQRTANAQTHDMKKKIAELAPRMKSGASSLAFLEILFWKSPQVAESMLAEYNWRKLVEWRTGGTTATNGDAQIGFASYKAKAKGPIFSDSDTQRLSELFETCNGYKDCLDRLVDEFDGRYKRNQISKRLQDLGLYKGKFSLNQKDRMRSLFEVHSNKEGKAKFQAIADDLGAGFTGNQVKNKLKELGFVVTSNRGSGGNGISARGAQVLRDVFGDDDMGASDRDDSQTEDEEEEAALERSYTSSSDDDDGGDDEMGGGGREMKKPTTKKKKKQREGSPSLPPPTFDAVFGLFQDGTDADKGVDVEMEAIENADREKEEHQKKKKKKKERRTKNGDGMATVPASGVDGHKQKKRPVPPPSSPEEEKEEHERHRQHDTKEVSDANAFKLRRRSDDHGRAAAEDDTAEQRRIAALALLRKKRGKGSEEAPHEDLIPAVKGTDTITEQVTASEALDHQQPVHHHHYQHQDENHNVANSPKKKAPATKTFGRLKKRLVAGDFGNSGDGGGEDALATENAEGGAVPLFDDLEDF